MASGSEKGPTRGLLEFEAEQKSFEIGGVTIGGQPGIQPTVLIGSIFYHGHKITVDEDKGEFQRDEAEKLIRGQEDFSERTGNPCMLDVVGATPEALRKHLEFAASVTKMPLLIDGTTPEVRLAGMQYAAEAGLTDRVVYNSIQPQINDDELKAITDAGIESAVILTYNMMDFTAAGRVQSVRDVFPKAEQAGVHKVIIDTCVLDLATLGEACSAIFDVKNEMGLPSGGGVHNAVATWKGLKTKMGKQAHDPCVASASAAATAVGADFLLYGPVEDAPYVFPAVAMVDTATSQLAMERGNKPVEDHPRFRIG